MMLGVLMMLSTAATAYSWPELSEPPSLKQSRPKDAALIVGIERYASVAPIAGAQRNANDWYVHFTKGMGIPASNVVLLRDNEGTVEKMKKYASAVAAQTSSGGTLWFVFIGHGAPQQDGKDGLLIGYDAQQEADSIAARSLPQKELLALLKRGAQSKTVAVLDACFSGKSDNGTELVKGLQPLIPMVGGATLDDATVVLTAAKSDQFAGPLPGAPRPAFSYLVLGGLRGWADQNHDGAVSAKELRSYADESLRALVHDRNQTPELRAKDAETALVQDVREAGPDLTKLMLASSTSASLASNSELAFGTGAAISVPIIKVVNTKSGLQKMDLRIEQLLDAALDAEQSKTVSAQSKAKAWCALAATRENNPYLQTADQGCTGWKKFADEQQRQTTAVDGDYKTLAGYLRLRHKTKEQKLAAVDAFLGAYASLDGNPKVALVNNAKRAVIKDGRVELPSGSSIAIEVVNELGDDYVLRTGRVLLNGQQVHQFLEPPADRRVAFSLAEQPAGKYELSFSLSMVSFETVGVIMSCTQPINLTELQATSLRFKLVKDSTPKMRIVNGEALGSTRPANDQLECTIQVLGGTYTKRPTNSGNTNTTRPTKRK